MAIVAGADFGTLSVRVTLLDSERGRLGTASAPYPLNRKREDPDFATQSHKAQMDAQMQPLDDYYLWCDHRALNEAQQITSLAHERSLEAIEWCGGVYSHTQVGISEAAPLVAA